jgi:hypothetical protein
MISMKRFSGKLIAKENFKIRYMIFVVQKMGLKQLKGYGLCPLIIMTT